MSKKRKGRKGHMGSSVDDFLKEEHIFEEAQAQAIKEVVAWQLDEAMRRKKYPKTGWPGC
jgi:antitoxin HicB